CWADAGFVEVGGGFAAPALLAGRGFAGLAGGDPSSAAGATAVFFGFGLATAGVAGAALSDVAAVEGFARCSLAVAGRAAGAVVSVPAVPVPSFEALASAVPGDPFFFASLPFF